MSPEAQRIAIAEACGWKNCRCDEGTRNMPPKGEPDDDFNRDVVEHAKHKPYCGFPTEPHREILPDYLNDLNAMHEAEEVLPIDKRVGSQGYMGFLWDTCSKNMHNGGSTWEIAHATAAQRAEAFLKTLGLWVEEPVSEATVEGIE